MVLIATADQAAAPAEQGGGDAGGGGEAGGGAGAGVGGKLQAVHSVTGDLLALSSAVGYAVYTTCLQVILITVAITATRAPPGIPHGPPLDRAQLLLHHRPLYAVEDAWRGHRDRRRRRRRAADSRAEAIGRHGGSVRVGRAVRLAQPLADRDCGRRVRRRRCRPPLAPSFQSPAATGVPRASSSFWPRYY